MNMRAEVSKDFMSVTSTSMRLVVARRMRCVDVINTRVRSQGAGLSMQVLDDESSLMRVHSTFTSSTSSLLFNSAATTTASFTP